MGLTESLEEFRGLHEGAKAGSLGTPDLERYRAARGRLTTLLLAAQHIALMPGQSPRRTLRAARALPAHLEFYDGTLRATTFQVSAGGFSAVLPRGSQVGETLNVSLGMPDREPVHAGARVVSVKEHLGDARTSFQFVDLDVSDAEWIERYVIDALLERLKAG